MARWFSENLIKSPHLRGALAIAVLCLVTVAGYYCHDFWRAVHTPILSAEQQKTLFEFQSGASVRQLVTQLQQTQLLKHPGYFVLLAWLKGQTTSLQAGEYAITPGMTPAELLTNLVAGLVVQHRFTIVEGWTIKQLRQAIAENKELTHTLSLVDDKALMRLLGAPDQHPEGQFYPDTYQFTRGMSDQALLQRAYQRMRQQLQDAWQQRNLDLPYPSPYQALIVASLVEKESAVVAERPIIAGIILARLKGRMRLQIDPTVIYGLQNDYQGKLTKSDLRRDTPYNTYVHKGLPPTPIALPSLTAIEAALHPEKTDYLYFVAKGDGSHHFSKTLQQQNHAVRKFITSK